MLTTIEASDSMVLIKLPDNTYAIDPYAIEGVHLVDVGINFRITIKRRDVKEDIELRVSTDSAAKLIFDQVLAMRALAISQRRHL